MNSDRIGRRYIAIDLGASSGRLLDVRIGDAGIEMSEAARFTHEPVLEDVNGSPRLCWDFESIMASVLNGLSAIPDGPVIDGIGVDSWGVDYGLLDRHGQLVAPVTAYRDTRHQKTFRSVQESVGREHIYAETGIQFQPFNTLYQLAADADDPARPLDRTERMLMMPCLVGNRLCGSVVGERTNASTTQCFDSRTNTWISGLLDSVGVPSSIMPEVLLPGREEPLGVLLPDVVRQTGLPVGTPVYAVASHDTASAVAAAPIQGKTDAFLSSGTWSLIGIELDRIISSKKALACNFTNEAGVFGLNRFLKNVAGLWLVQQVRATYSSDGRAYSWGELIDLAENETPFQSIVNPDHPDLISPGDMPTRIRALCAAHGEHVPETDGAVVRCILDSLALRYAQCIDEIEDVAECCVEQIVLVGGGARNKLLNQLTSDTTQRVVRVGSPEATGLGNALLQHASIEGIHDPKELRSLLYVSEEHVPNVESRCLIPEARARFQKIVENESP